MGEASPLADSQTECPSLEMESKTWNHVSGWNSLLPTSCVTLNSYLTSLCFNFLFCKMGIIEIFL